MCFWHPKRTLEILTDLPSNLHQAWQFQELFVLGSNFLGSFQKPKPAPITWCSPWEKSKSFSRTSLADWCWKQCRLSDLHPVLSHWTRISGPFLFRHPSVVRESLFLFQLPICPTRTLTLGNHLACTFSMTRISCSFAVQTAQGSTLSRFPNMGT